MNGHMKIHSGPYPFECTYCHHTFNRKETMKKHLRRKHTGEMLFLCSKCGELFSKKSTLKTHNERNHKEEKDV